MKIRKGPDGIHIFDRKTGTNILLDDKAPPACLWTKSPRQVSIALTNACDLHCTHCYASKIKGMLDTQLVKQWILELDQSGCFGVGFGGGEPTLHPGLVDICKFGQMNTGLAMTMTTHGHHLNNRLLGSLEGNIDFIRISMDGIGKVYESIRGQSFDKLLCTFGRLGSEIPFGINYVVNSETINLIDEASRIVQDVGASELLLLPEEEVGRGSKIDDVSLKRLRTWVGNYNGPLRLAVSSTYASEFPTDLPLKMEPEFLAYAHIDALGNIKRTSFDDLAFKIRGDGVMSAYNDLNKKYLGELL